jgi:hypothetical protein
MIKAICEAFDFSVCLSFSIFDIQYIFDDVDDTLRLMFYRQTLNSSIDFLSRSHQQRLITKIGAIMKNPIENFGF